MRGWNPKKQKKEEKKEEAHEMKAISGYVLVETRKLKQPEGILHFIIGRLGGDGSFITSNGFDLFGSIEEAEEDFAERKSNLSKIWLADLSMVMADTFEECALPIFTRSKSLIFLHQPFKDYLVLCGSEYTPTTGVGILPIPFKDYETAWRRAQGHSSLLSTYSLKKIRRLK